MATTKQKIVLGKLVENSRNGIAEPLGAVLLSAGYSPATAIKPSQVTKAKGFTELLEEVLPDEELTKVHKELLGARRLEHMTFPLGPKTEDEEEEDQPPERLEPQGHGGALKRRKKITERNKLSDEEIEQMLEELGCRVRKIVHGEMARHVYFWAPNDKTRHDALKLAYDLKGKVVKSKDPVGDTYNTFIQQNNINPNAPKAKALVDDTLDMLMKKTSRKVIDL